MLYILECMLADMRHFYFYCFKLETLSSGKPVISATRSAAMPLSSIFLATSTIPSARPSALPSTRPFALPSTRPFASPSASPSAYFFFSAVLMAFTMSRYAFMLSSYNFWSCSLNSEPNKRLKPKSVCGFMYFSIIMLLLLFHQQIYCIFVNKPTSAVGNNLYMPYQSLISVSKQM